MDSQLDPKSEKSAVREGIGAGGLSFAGDAGGSWHLGPDTARPHGHGRGSLGRVLARVGDPACSQGRLLRNVAVALGNRGSPEAVPALVRGLEDPEPLVRGHAAWALGRIGTEEARKALGNRLELETDAWVSREIEAAHSG